MFNCPKQSKVNVVGMIEKVSAFEKEPMERTF